MPSNQRERLYLRLSQQQPRKPLWQRHDSRNWDVHGKLRLEQIWAEKLQPNKEAWSRYITGGKQTRLARISSGTPGASEKR